MRNSTHDSMKQRTGERCRKQHCSGEHTRPARQRSQFGHTNLFGLQMCQIKHVQLPAVRIRGFPSEAPSLDWVRSQKSPNRAEPRRFKQITNIRLLGRHSCSFHPHNCDDTHRLYIINGCSLYNISHHSLINGHRYCFNWSFIYF